MRTALLVSAAIALVGCSSDTGEPAASPSSRAEVTATTSPATAPASTTPSTTVAATTTAAPDTTAAPTVPPTTAVSPTVAPTAPVTRSPTTASPDTSVPGPAEITAPSIDSLLGTDTVLNLAHAGGDQAYPHSTMYAFTEATNAGANLLEMDVRLTGDGIIVVHHDADTVKATPESLVVAEHDLAELQRLDKGYWWSPECWPCHDLADDAYPFRGVRTGDVPPPEGYTPDDFRLVTLAEVSNAFPDLPLDIEIKGEGPEGADVAEALAAELRRLGRVDSSIVVSFDASVVAAFHAAAPNVATSPGVAEMVEWLVNGVPLGEHHDVIQVPPEYEGFDVLGDPELDTLNKARAAGVDVWVWPSDAATQENEEFYRTLIGMGIDGIIAGRPAAATAAIAGATS